MSFEKKIGTVATAAVLTLALLAPTGADARNGRVAAGIVGGLAAGALFGAALSGGYWGPYPYYGYPGPVYYDPLAPYWGSGPFWGPYGYGDCHVRAVRHRRHVHYVRVCY
ncbi:hypothetical protein ACQR1V_27365 [Bradyrhizobium oligotrophicum]|uniref:hypothetical protein n=1 Tax=Bradyrhizobium oligotrophicum TaxID=44255 RepID=UPI003EBEA58F